MRVPIIPFSDLRNFSPPYSMVRTFSKPQHWACDSRGGNYHCPENPATQRNLCRERRTPTDPRGGRRLCRAPVSSARPAVLCPLFEAQTLETQGEKAVTMGLFFTPGNEAALPRLRAGAALPAPLCQQSGVRRLFSPCSTLWAAVSCLQRAPSIAFLS